MDDVLVHVTDWPAMLRYATHRRRESWMPPQLNLETARMGALIWELSSVAYAAYVAVAIQYAGSPLLHPTGAEISGSDGAPRRLPLRRVLAVLGHWSDVPGALDALVAAGLLTLATVEGERVTTTVVELTQG
jgi:hypothetical protein